MVALWTHFEAGEKKGELKSQRKMARYMLQRQLTQRFGALLPTAVVRLESAASEKPL
jgi:hypothetical protein